MIIENLIVIICILLFISSIYLLNRYSQVTQFRINYRTNLLYVIKSESNSNKLIKLVHMYSKHNFLELWLSFKPLVLRSYFSRDEIKLLGRKVKQETESIEEIISEYNKIGCVI